MIFSKLYHLYRYSGKPIVMMVQNLSACISSTNTQVLAAKQEGI